MTFGAAEIIGLIALQATLAGGVWGLFKYLLNRQERQRTDFELRLAAIENAQKAYMDRAEVLQHFNRLEDGVQRVHGRMDRFMEAAAGRGRQHQP